MTSVLTPCKNSRCRRTIVNKPQLINTLLVWTDFLSPPSSKSPKPTSEEDHLTALKGLRGVISVTGHLLPQHSGLTPAATRSERRSGDSAFSALHSDSTSLSLATWRDQLANLVLVILQSGAPPGPDDCFSPARRWEADGNNQPGSSARGVTTSPRRLRLAVYSLSWCRQ